MFFLLVVRVVYHIIQMQQNMFDVEILLLDILMKKIMSTVICLISSLFKHRNKNIRMRHRRDIFIYLMKIKAFVM
jgi:hypothetical protein